MNKQIATSCTHDCPCGCSVLVTTKDGQVISHKADPRNPVTRNFLCTKGNRYIKRYASAERLLKPLRRKGTHFVTISWEDALDLAAEKLLQTRRESGPLSTLWAQYSGSLSLLNLIMPKIFWIHLGGSTITEGGISIDALQAAQKNDFGACLVHDLQDLENSKNIVIWGRNPAVTNVHLMPFIKEARERGAKLTVIDPRYSETARLADHHIAPRPGGDGYLAIGVAKEIRRRQKNAQGFVTGRTNGWGAYLSMLDQYKDTDLCLKADVTGDQINHLASCYWNEGPCATFLGLGVNWWKQGGAHSRLIHSLIFLSGNVGIPGGGANFFNMEFPFSTQIFREEMERAKKRGVKLATPRRVLLPLLSHEIKKAQDPQIRLGWFSMFNPVATAPDSNSMKQALGGLDFVIVTEQFMTATAQCADLVLPATTYLEEDDVVYCHGNAYMGPVNAAVSPRGEARSNMWIFQSLAKRMGFETALEGNPWDWVARMWSPLEEQGVTLNSVRKGPVRRKQPAIPYQDHVFPTPDNKFQFITSYEGREGPSPGLYLLMVKKRSFLNSQLLREDAEPYPIVYLNHHVMAREGLKDGDHIWLYNSLDRIEVIAKSSEKTRSDVAELNPSMWRDDRGGINRLRPALLSDLGPTAAVNETKVKIKKM